MIYLADLYHDLQGSGPDGHPAGFPLSFFKRGRLALSDINVIIFYKPSVFMEGYLYFLCDKETKFITFALAGNFRPLQP
jgi:hypothetical protein